MISKSLTVKWVLDGGASWFATDAVAAIPVGGNDPLPPQGVMGFIARVEFDRDDSGVRASIDRGTVYILNSAGKTIDTIHLGSVPPVAA